MNNSKQKESLEKTCSKKIIINNSDKFKKKNH